MTSLIFRGSVEFVAICLALILLKPKSISTVQYDAVTCAVMTHPYNSRPNTLTRYGYVIRGATSMKISNIERYEKFERILLLLLIKSFSMYQKNLRYGPS